MIEFSAGSITSKKISRINSLSNMNVNVMRYIKLWMVNFYWALSWFHEPKGVVFHTKYELDQRIDPVKNFTVNETRMQAMLSYKTENLYFKTSQIMHHILIFPKIIENVS